MCTREMLNHSSIRRRIPWHPVSEKERAMLQDLLSKQVESQESRSLAITAQTLSNERRFAGQRHMVYDTLASAAAFKAKTSLTR